MKTLLINRFFILFILTIGWMTVKGQQQWEVPGDNFSLEGALEMFKKSESPEEFERMLNDPEARVNNLDLNGDGYIDYIRVIDMYEGNVHAFILQALISERQSQDIVVITLEKLDNGKAILQITGDADIYGVETIIEPTREVRTYAGARSSDVVVNVWAWPLVRYIYSPHYRVWISPWGWSYRPYWWSPWRPVVYYDYYSYWSPYRSYYSVCYTHRVVYAHRIYRPYRTTSVIVYNRHHHRIKEYRSTYIDRNGRYQAGNNGYGRRQPSTARYNSNGRIVSNERVDSRNSSQSSIDQRRSSVRRESVNSTQRSSDNSRQYSDNYNARRSTGRSNGEAGYERPYRSSNMKPSPQRSSGNSETRGSSGNSSLQRSRESSDNGSNYRQSNGNSNFQRSARKSSGDANIQRPQQRSNSNSSYRQSSRDTNSRKSYNRSSGNSGSRSAVRSSGNRKSSGQGSNVQRSSGGSKSRSSGNTNSGNRRRR